MGELEGLIGDVKAASAKFCAAAERGASIEREDFEGLVQTIESATEIIRAATALDAAVNKLLEAM